MCIKKFFKKILEKMIYIGNSIIDTIFIGQQRPDHIDIGSVRVWPDGESQYYLTLTPTVVQSWNGYYRQETITVSTNAPNWSLVAESTPSGNYFTAVKTNDNTITWTMQENNTEIPRVGFVTVTIVGDTLSAQTMIYQNTGYVISVDNTNPTVLSSGATTLSVSVRSKYGDTAVPVTYQITGNNWLRYVSMRDEGGGHYIYNFSVEANSDTQARYNSITFTQTQGGSTPYKSASLGITQKEMFVPDQISGFTMYANDGQWMLGRFKTGEQSAGSYGNQPIYAMAVLRATVPPYDYTVEYDFTSYYGIPTPTTSIQLANTVSRTVTQDTNNPVTIPGGGTGYGWVISSYPNMQPPSNVTFNVTKNT